MANDEIRETVADIEAWIRRHADIYGYDLADRIKVAWKHEREALESHVRSLQSQLKVAYSCGEQPQGNAAAMCDALRTLRQRFDNNVMAYQDRYFKFSGWHWHKKAAEAARWRDVFHELREACDAALAAPARNCDMYPIRKTAQIKFEKSLPDIVKTEVRNYPFAAMDMFIDWLLANATEKGGAR
jgi:hypothetical protein